MEMEIVLRTIRAPGYVLSQDKGEFMMLWAAVHGYLTVINFLLEQGINHLFQDVHGRTPLLLAAKNCHWEVFRAFSNKGQILHVQDKQGYSLLSWAFQARHEVIIQLLFENGADPNEHIKDPDDKYNSGSEVPLFLAVRRESERIVGFLLNIGADPSHFKYVTDRFDGIQGDSTPSKDTENIVSPLSLAAGKGYHGIVAAFLNNGANLFVCHIALREAMMNGNDSIVSLIMEKGIRDNWIIAEHGESLLYHAASTGYIDVVRILPEKGVNPNSRNSNSIKRSIYLSGVRDGIWERGTPLCCAAKRGNIEIARLLLSKNADPNIASPLFCAIERNHLEMAELLLQHGAKLNDLNAAALLEGVRRGHHNMVELLLAKQIPPEPKYPKVILSALLFSAVFEKHMNVVRVLLNNGANPNLTFKDGWTVLSLAVQHKCADIVELLLQHDVYVNYADKLGRTALFVAVLLEYHDIARTLLEKGNADPHTMTCAGRSPLSMAYDIGDSKLISLLSGKTEVGEKKYTSYLGYCDYNCDICELSIGRSSSFYRCSICEDYDGNAWIGCIECVAGDSGCKDRLHTLEKLASIRGGMTMLGKFSRWRSVK
jgi:ankyrin repeat protein